MNPVAVEVTGYDEQLTSYTGHTVTPSVLKVGGDPVTRVVFATPAKPCFIKFANDASDLPAIGRKFLGFVVGEASGRPVVLVFNN